MAGMPHGGLGYGGKPRRECAVRTHDLPPRAGDTSDFANLGVIIAEGYSFQQDVRVIRRTQPNWLVFGGLELVFDKFKVGERQNQAQPFNVLFVRLRIPKMPRNAPNACTN